MLDTTQLLQDTIGQPFPSPINISLYDTDREHSPDFTALARQEALARGGFLIG